MKAVINRLGRSPFPDLLSDYHVCPPFACTTYRLTQELETQQRATPPPQSPPVCQYAHGNRVQQRFHYLSDVHTRKRSVPTGPRTRALTHMPLGASSLHIARAICLRALLDALSSRYSGVAVVVVHCVVEIRMI